MITILYENREINFYADGSSSGVPDNMVVGNYIPLIIRRLQAILIELCSDYYPVINGSVGSSGGLHVTDEYSDSKPSQKGTISGGK
jgi:hypothetical protein